MRLSLATSRTHCLPLAFIGCFAAGSGPAAHTRARPASLPCRSQHRAVQSPQSQASSATSTSPHKRLRDGQAQARNHHRRPLPCHPIAFARRNPRRVPRESKSINGEPSSSQKTRTCPSRSAEASAAHLPSSSPPNAAMCFDYQFRSLLPSLSRFRSLHLHRSRVCREATGLCHDPARHHRQVRHRLRHGAGYAHRAHRSQSGWQRSGSSRHSRS